MASDPVQRKIIAALAGSPKTISELSKATGIHRVTISKHASLLEAKGVLKRQQFGKAKVYSLNKKGGTAKAKKARKPKANLEAAVRKLVAVELAKRKIVSLEEAAGVAGVSEGELKAMLDRKRGG